MNLRLEKLPLLLEGMEVGNQPLLSLLPAFIRLIEEKLSLTAFLKHQNKSKNTILQFLATFIF
jgi:hypothetical protein